jgi:hypothetical protein
MRGARLFIFASTLFSCACATPPPPAASADRASSRLESDPGFRIEFPEPLPPQDRAPGGGAAAGPVPVPPAPAPAPAAGVAKTSLELAPRKEPTLEEVLRLQKDLAARFPASDDEKLRLALLHASAGNLEDAERILGSLRARTNKLVPLVEFYLRRQLGDHKEAGKLLAQLNDEDRLATGFVIERAELVSRVRRFRDYTPAEHDRVAPGGDVHLYVEPRNFALQRSGDKHTFHLRYEWMLLDDRSQEQPVPAWERAPVEEREDRVTSNGAVAEFYQSFRLPLPANLATGHYRVRVSVTDVVAGKTDRAFVPIYVMPLERTR